MASKYFHLFLRFAFLFTEHISIEHVLYAQLCLGLGLQEEMRQNPCSTWALLERCEMRLLVPCCFPERKPLLRSEEEEEEEGAVGGRGLGKNTPGPHVGWELSQNRGEVK